MRTEFRHQIEVDLMKRMEKFIDGIRYRSKAHFAEISILEHLEKLERRKNYTNPPRVEKEE